MSKTHWRKFHPSKYLGAADFDGAETMVLTISSAGREDVKDTSGKSEVCLVVRFQGNHKPLIVNVTNAKSIEKVTGSSFIEDWAGHKIELYTTEVSAFGELREAVRVKPAKPKGKAAMSPESPRWSGLVQAIHEGSYTREKLKSQFVISPAHLKVLESELAALAAADETDEDLI